MEQINEVLKLLKLDLGIKSTAKDDYYIAFLQSNANELENSGAKLELSKTEDKLLLSDYCAWLIRHKETGEEMPKHLECRINNRKIKGRAKA